MHCKYDAYKKYEKQIKNLVYNIIFVQILLTDDQQTLIEPINYELNMNLKLKKQAKNCKNELLHM